MSAPTVFDCFRFMELAEIGRCRASVSICVPAACEGARSGRRRWSFGSICSRCSNAIGSLVPITSMKASSLSFSIAPRPAFIEVETTVGPARARGRPRMRAVPYSDLCVSSRRSRGYEKPKRAFTGPLGSTQHRELRPAHRKRPSHRETKRASNGM